MEKKRLYRAGVKSKSDQDYVKHRLARRKSKIVVRTAKEQSWKKYGKDLTELSKHPLRHFYKRVNARRLWDEPLNPTTVINDKDGSPLHTWTQMEINKLSPNSPQNTQTKRDHLFLSLRSNRHWGQAQEIEQWEWMDWQQRLMQHAERQESSG